MVELVTNLCTSLPSAQGRKNEVFLPWYQPKVHVCWFFGRQVSQRRLLQIPERKMRIGGRR